jgi:hypothetical protein
VSADRMTCMDCGQTKAWPDGFPSRIYAECWECAWNKHVHSSHPKTVRRIKRAARKRVKARREQESRRITDEEIRKAMIGPELQQAFGIHPNNAPTETEPETEPAAGAVVAEENA